MKTLAALSGFLCLGRQGFLVIIGILLFFRSCVFGEFVCEEMEKKEPVQGGQAVMEHLISCSLWEPFRHRDARGSVILRVC